MSRTRGRTEPRSRAAAPSTPTRRELILSAATTVGVAAFILAIGPKPGDAPAHLYRTFLVDHGIVLWDNLWYAGQYPLASYSLLYYFPAAVLGNLPLVLASAVAASILFMLISYREWGAVARWPARIFGVLAAAPMFTGLYTFALGFATLLAALRLLQRNRPWLVVVFAALTLGFSPLAFGFLCLILCAIAATRGERRTREIGLAVAVLAIGGFELALLAFFRTPGIYPFNPWDLLAMLSLSVVCALLARRTPGGNLVATFFVLWGIGGAFFYLVPTAMGDNWTRLRGFLFPVMLIVAMQARFRPRILTIVALTGALAYNITPYLMLIPYRTDSGPSTASFWRPAITFLDRHARPSARVEVVPTAAHWESYWIPRAGFALARGWYRQLDEATNPVLYSSHLTGAKYTDWLHRMGIDYVLLPAAELDPLGGPTEARLLRSGSAHVQEVFHDRLWTVYRVPHPTPILTGHAKAHVIRLDHQLIEGWVAAKGTYLLRVHYTPYWTVEPSGTCVERAGNAMTKLRLPRAGRFTLRIPDGVLGGLDSVFGVLTKPRQPSCHGA